MVETYKQMYDRQFKESLELEKQWKGIVHSEKDLARMEKALGELRTKHAQEFGLACKDKEFREDVEAYIGCKLIWIQDA